jgi:predicted AlkP superfamily phosphohydrolase/phosphomutase
MSARVVLFGLDGVTFDVVDPLLAAGKMPALAGLIARGVRADLRSTCPPVSAPAWVTFLTGKQPGKHGVFNFQNLDARHYAGFSEALVNSSYFRGATLLDHAGRTSNVRSLSYRVPMTFPAWDVPNGVVVSGFPLPDRRRTYARPVEVEAEVGPGSPLSYDEMAAAKKALDVAAIDRANKHELEGFERMTARYLERGTELLIAFTGIPDTLHHGFWAFHDPRSPLHDPSAAPALRTIIERWYTTIDAAIGRLTANLDPETAVIVLSDHGGGPAPLRHVNLNAFLRESGRLATAGGGRAAVATGVGSLLERGRQALPGRLWLKRHLPERLGRSLRGLRNATGAIAWERTRAYATPIYYPITGVWVNLAGRQSKGIVQPGAEYESLRDELVREIAALRDPDTGVPLVERVLRREDVYAGPHLADAPDLIVDTAPGYHGGLGLERLVTDVPAATLRTASGSHTREGIFVAAGGPFRAGAALDAPSLADVLPTALHLLDVALPDDLDGRVIEESLDPAYLAAHPVRITAGSGNGNGRVTLGEDDEGEMRKFLQGLGYVE